MPGLLNAHSVFITALVRYDFCVIAYGMEHVADRRLWGILRAGQVPGPLDMTLKEMEKVGHRAFCELRSLVARSLTSLKRKHKTK